MSYFFTHIHSLINKPTSQAATHVELKRMPETKSPENSTDGTELKNLDSTGKSKLFGSAISSINTLLNSNSTAHDFTRQMYDHYQTAADLLDSYVKQTEFDTKLRYREWAKGKSHTLRSNLAKVKKGQDSPYFLHDVNVPANALARAIRRLHEELPKIKTPAQQHLETYLKLLSSATSQFQDKLWEAYMPPKSINSENKPNQFVPTK